MASQKKTFCGIDSGEILQSIKDDYIMAYLALGLVGKGCLKDGEPYFLEVELFSSLVSLKRNVHLSNQLDFPGVLHSFHISRRIGSVCSIHKSFLRELDLTSLIVRQLTFPVHKDVASSFGASIYSIGTRLCEIFDFGRSTCLRSGCDMGHLGNTIQQKYESTLTEVDLCPHGKLLKLR